MRKIVTNVVADLRHNFSALPGRDLGDYFGALWRPVLAYLTGGTSDPLLIIVASESSCTRAARGEKPGIGYGKRV